MESIFNIKRFEDISPLVDLNSLDPSIKVGGLFKIDNNLFSTDVERHKGIVFSLEENKADYYRLLQEVRTKNSWEEWVLFILEGVEQTSRETIDLINSIKELMYIAKKKIQTEASDIYSKDLLDILFLQL